ncbi:MAG: lysophospholipid acyltransferase family protein [Nitrospirota bacterium]
MIRARVLSFIGWALISLWGRTANIIFQNREILDRQKAEGKGFILAFWHGDLFLLAHPHRGLSAVVPASESRDGEIMARLLNRFGFRVVRGSSKRKGARAAIGLIDGLRSGLYPALAVDGPRGPLHEVKQGVVYLAGKLNVPIIPMTARARRYWILEQSWDKLVIPAPLTDALILYGKPIVVNGTSDDEIESKRRELETAMIKLTQEAQMRVEAKQKEFVNCR